MKSAGFNNVVSAQPEEISYRKNLSFVSPTSLLTGMREENIPITKQITQQRTQQPSSVSLINPASLRENQIQLLSQPQPSIPKQQPRQRQIPRQAQQPQQPISPVTRFGFMFDLFGKEEQPRKEVAYLGFIKSGNKWVKVTDKPATKRGAIDRVAEYVDRNISARWKVEPIKKKIQGKERFVEVETQKLLQPTGYWENNKNKFRTFQQRKGVRTQLPNGAIELQRFRLDSPEEVKKIQKEKKAANVRGFFGI
jgi:hypothetical protein